MERKNFYYLVSVLMIIFSLYPFYSLYVDFFKLGVRDLYDFLFFIIPTLISLIILIFPSVYYIRNAKNKKLNNKIYYSAILYLISFILGVIGSVLAFIPCFTGPADGFCMLGILFVVPVVFLIWIIAFVLFVWGRVSQSTIK